MNGLRSLATFGYPIKSFETGREMETITVEASALQPPPLPDIRVKILDHKPKATAAGTRSRSVVDSHLN